MSRPPRNDGGVALVEFALIAPVALMLTLGAFEATRLFRASWKVRLAAQTLADPVSQQTNVSTTIMSNLCSGAQMTLSPLTSSGFAAAVTSVVYSSSGRAKDWQDTSCGSAAATTNAPTLATTYTPTSGDSAIVVQATYAYKAPVTYVLPSTFSFSAIAVAKPRNGSKVTHD